VVIRTDSLTFEEYVELRLLAFVLWITNIPIAYDTIMKLLREYNVDVFDLYYKIMKSREDASTGVRESFSKFRQSTIEELWDSPEQIFEHFQNQNEYDKLLREESGINVIQYHEALVRKSHMEEWTENIIRISYELISEKKHLDDNFEEKFKDVSNYCRGLSFNILGKDRFEIKKEFNFSYDIPKWLEDQSQSTLIDFKTQSKFSIMFEITEKQYKVVNDEFEKYGESLSGIAKALRRLPFRLLWRTPTLIMENQISN